MFSAYTRAGWVLLVAALALARVTPAISDGALKKRATEAAARALELMILTGSRAAEAEAALRNVRPSKQGGEAKVDPPDVMDEW